MAPSRTTGGSAMITSEDIDRIVEGRTVTSAFLQTVSAHGDLVALRERTPDGDWEQWTFDEYAEHIAGAAAGLRALGVEPGDRVVLMMRNVVAFHMLDMAVTFCGATCISIYNSSSPEQVAYLAGHCGARVAIVDDGDHLERVLAAKPEVPSLTDVFVVERDWDRLLAKDPVDIDEAAARCRPDDLATVIYTSGTTGPPK